MTSLVLVRHGRALDVDGRCIGHTDVPLSPDGRAGIARFAAEWAASKAECIGGPPTAIYSSDLRRASESASALAEVWKLPVTHDARLREMSFGAWDGKRWDDLTSSDGDRFRAWSDDWVSIAPPDGETVSQLERRARSWINDVIVEYGYANECLVAVTHAGWIRVALCILLQRPLAAMFDFSPDHASASIVSTNKTDGTADLIAFNWVPTFPS